MRLARSPAEVDAAQALRYRVFYEEMAADPSSEMGAPSATSTASMLIPTICW